MAGQTTSVLRKAIRSVAKAGTAALPDRELLRRFADEDDQAAFAALVSRPESSTANVPFSRRSL